LEGAAADRPVRLHRHWIAWRRTESIYWGLPPRAAGARSPSSSTATVPASSATFSRPVLAILESANGCGLARAAVIWANCHGGFFLGWIVCGAYAAESLLRRAPDTRRVLLMSGLTVLLSGLNPNG